MYDLNFEQFMVSVVWLVLMTCPVILVYMIAKKKLSKTRFLRFLGILLIGFTCSMIPTGLFGLLFGAPAVVISSILVSIFLDKE